MNTAQQIANAAQQDFGAAIRSAREQGRRGAVWFAGCNYTFGDGSVLTLRSGRIESPAPSPMNWTADKRAEFDI